MNETVIIINIIKLLKSDFWDSNKVKLLAKNINEYRVKFPYINWDFLSNIEQYNKEDVKIWLKIMLNYVYIL